MKRKLSIFLAVIAAISLLTVSVISCGGAGAGGGGNRGGGGGGGTNPTGPFFVITSPYADVNWSWHHYKAAQHVHTTNSDGGGTMEQVLQLHYDLDYDIIGITDHVWKGPEGARIYLDLIASVTQETWTTTNHNFGAGPRTENLTFVTQARLDEFQNGTATSTTTTSIAGRARTNTRPLLVIPGTAEFALQPGEDEMNVFFFNGNAPVAWQRSLREGIQIVQTAGGITFINHPGRFTGGRHFMGSPSSLSNPSNQSDFINRYADIFMDFSDTTLVGMEIFNRRDGDSRQDRVLWDNVNTVTIPQGRFVWGYGNDDLHTLRISATTDGVHTNYNVFLMPETTMANLETNLRNAMVKGHSYIVTVAAFNENVINITAATPGSERPYIQSISTGVDSITINAGNASRIVWISEGLTIHTTQGSSGTLNLADPNIIGSVGVYVRANIIGPGGMAVIQPIGTARIGAGVTPPSGTEPPTGFSGTWTWESFDDEDDSGNSTIDELTVENGVVTVKGALRPGFEYPYAGWDATPEGAETLTKLKEATTISFRVAGTPGMWKIKLLTTDVLDDCYFERLFNVSTTERTVTVNVNDFRQPAWGIQLSNPTVNRDNITAIQWQTPDGQNFEFEITMRDLVLN